VFETTRKATWIAESLRKDPIPDIALSAPDPLTETEIARVHDSAYVTAVKTGKPRALAESQGFTWDEGLGPMVLASNGGMVAAALTALEAGVAGSLSSGMHHASRSQGTGFCTFNGLVLAAQAALDAGCKSVLILDLDAHCGGGTHSLIGEDSRIWQVDISVNGYDAYVPSGHNVLFIVNKAEEYLRTIAGRLKILEAHAPRFDLCLYNAGMDPHEHSYGNGLAGADRPMLAERERLVFSWCREQRIPVAFGLAGGYISAHLRKADLVNLHRITLAVAANGRKT
jgi:acetoin utilization deacetylase AcuC-like enzyme